jgi:hypothetical protein
MTVMRLVLAAQQVVLLGKAASCDTLLSRTSTIRVAPEARSISKSGAHSSS